MAANSTRQKKPAKPRRDFPLFPHQSGYWTKKVRQKFHYFGKVSVDPKGAAALELWLDRDEDLLAGRTAQHAFRDLQESRLPSGVRNQTPRG